MRSLVVSFAVMALASSLPLAPTPAAAGPVDTLDAIGSDMTLKAEDPPLGNPWHWATQPRLTLGDDPKQYRAAIAWGVIYESAAGNPATNTRVEIRNIRLWILSRRTGKWYVAEASKAVKGSLFKGDFKTNESLKADVRAEPDGGRSVKPGQGYCFHFWPQSGRVRIQADDIAGIVSTFEARLVVDDPSRPDDRAKANFTAAAGGDYWLNLTIMPLPTEGVNMAKSDEIGIGRFKRVLPTWRAFNMSTLTPAQLASTPPPLDPPADVPG